MNWVTIGGAIVRHLVGFLGGSLFGEGLLTEDEMKMLGGALSTAAAVAWSIYRKWQARRVPVPVK